MEREKIEQIMATGEFETISKNEVCYGYINAETEDFAASLLLAPDLLELALADYPIYE